MTKERKRFFLSNFFSCWIYTIVETPVVERILFGRWWTAFHPATFIPSYVIGLCVAYWFPCAAFADYLQGRYFASIQNERSKKWVANLLFATIFEFVFGLIIQAYFVFLVPEGSHDISEFFISFLKQYFPCIPINALISLLVLEPCDRLAEKLIP